MDAFVAVVVALGLAAFAGVPLALYAVGRRRPAEHVVTRTVSVAAPPERVFAVVSDVRRAPRWRTDVSHVRVVEETPRLRYREHGRFGPVLFEVETSAAPSRWVACVVPDRGDLAFAGRWSWALEPDGGGGTRVTLTEEGTVRSPIFRALMHHLFGEASTVERTLRALARFVAAGDP